MRRRKIWLNFVFALITLLCLVSIIVIFTPKDSYELTVAVISLDVALLALYISLRTFFSIDEVNAISRMDGNVMENPRYRPNILRAVFRFQKSGFTETSKDFTDYLDGLFSDSNKQSGAHLSDNVQEVTNMMVLVPYFIHTFNHQESALQREKISELLTKIRNRIDNFREISDGSCKLLDETFNLIDAVFLYQSTKASGKLNPTKLLEIRGSIFINPVAIVLYYDYLGLYFLRRAQDILNKHQSGKSYKGVKEKVNACTADEKSMALVYCNKASESLKHAKENVGDDSIWTGYVCFNIARAEYLKMVLNESFCDKTPNDWEMYINESIRSWITSNKIIAEHFAGSSQATWLQQAFVSEENFVRLHKVIMQMQRKEKLTDYNGKTWLKNYSDITETPFFKSVPETDPQQLTDNLVKYIKDSLKK